MDNSRHPSATESLDKKRVVKKRGATLKRTVVVIHCERGHRCTLLPPIEPNGEVARGFGDCPEIFTARRASMTVGFLSRLDITGSADPPAGAGLCRPPDAPNARGNPSVEPFDITTCSILSSTPIPAVTDENREHRRHDQSDANVLG